MIINFIYLIYGGDGISCSFDDSSIGYSGDESSIAYGEDALPAVEEAFRWALGRRSVLRGNKFVGPLFSSFCERIGIFAAGKTATVEAAGDG